MVRHSNERHRYSTAQISHSPDDDSGRALRFVSDGVMSELPAAVMGFSVRLLLYISSPQTLAFRSHLCGWHSAHDIWEKNCKKGKQACFYLLLRFRENNRHDCCICVASWMHICPTQIVKFAVSTYHLMQAWLAYRTWRPHVVAFVWNTLYTTDVYKRCTIKTSTVSAEL